MHQKIKKLSIEDTNGAFAAADEKGDKKRKPGKTRAKNFPFILKFQPLAPLTLIKEDK